ncbi:hypothetical protein Lupro_01825 [Lutibacter profundi]|uniref:DUF4296 domain-containing protein n=1 Tax=Lutibacter profundi TaxID=1622118 RepID=A0A0X8G4U6_9FLAO|nr:hypothetical protein [Lutibacter profundi]AMC10068.1 hypothetical protein Lupro_01825 [Lutibacter profundi]
MKKISLLLMLLLTISSCNAQTNTDKNKGNNEAVKPKTNIVVHKEYDENGNLIRVDSSYTYVYSTLKNDSLLQKKLFDNLKLDLNNNSQNIDSILFNNFFNDDLFKMNDFYTDHFFNDNFKLQEKQLKQYLKRLDSIKNQFYKNSFK